MYQVFHCLSAAIVQANEIKFSSNQVCKFVKESVHLIIQSVQSGVTIWKAILTTASSYEESYTKNEIEWNEIRA